MEGPETLISPIVPASASLSSLKMRTSLYKSGLPIEPAFLIASSGNRQVEKPQDSVSPYPWTKTSKPRCWKRSINAIGIGAAAERTLVKQLRSRFENEG